MIKNIYKLKITSLITVVLLLIFSATGNAQGKDSIANHSEVIVIPGNEISTNHSLSASPKASVESEKVTVPTASVGNMLFGRIPGLIVLDSNGEPGLDAASLFIRGKSTYNNNDLVVFVDGFQVDLSYFENMSAFEIEKIEVLKDAASLAPFGMRGANGILNVTTKRGKTGTPTISAQVRGGVQQPVVIRKPLGTERYTNLYDEAFSNDNGRQWEPVFAPSQVGLLPDVDWYDEVLRDAAPYMDADVSVRGGDENAKYFVTFGSMNQSGLYDVPVNDTLANSSVQRYNIRANVDLNLLSFLEAKIDLGGRIENRSYPARSSWNIWNEMATYPSSVYPVKNEDGSWTGTPVYNFNPVASSNALGRRSTHDRSLQFNFVLKEKLDMLLKGLYFSQAVSVSSWTRDGAGNTRNYARFLNGQKQTTDEDTPYSRDEDRGQNQWLWQHYTATVGYEAVKDEHRVTAASNVLYNSYNTDIDQNGAAGKWTEYNYANIGGFANYGYDNRYSATFTYAYAASDNYHRNNRWKFYPSLSAAWLICNESFLKENNAVNSLKLRLSAGQNGWDPMKTERNLWQKYYSWSGGIMLGDPQASHNSGMAPIYVPNEDIAPEKSTKYDVGFDLRLWDHLDANLTLFRENRTGIVTRNWSAPSTAGISNPAYENIGEVTNEGFELELSWKQQLNDFYYSIRGMAMYYKNTIDNMAEIVTLPNIARTGRSIGVVMGFEADGFYNSEDFDENGNLRPGIPRPTFGVVQPGDIRYKDLYEDMIIDENDKTSIGNPAFPNMVYSFDLGIGYKAIDLFVLLEGTGGRELNLLNYPRENIAFRDNGNAFPIAEKRWAYYPDQGIDTRATASFPRLSLMDNNNNYQNSTVWMMDGDYLKIRNLTLGFNLPPSVLKKMGVSNFRLELIGLNILTLSQYFVKKLSGNSAIIYKFIDMVSIFSRVCINTEHVNKSL